MTTILWVRQDLRLEDQPALAAAVGRGAVVPVYVLDDETPGEWRIGGAQRWWLHGSLTALDRSLRAKGSRLVLRRGRAVDVLTALMAETGAERIHANRHYEPWWREAEAGLGDALTLHDGNFLAPIEQVRTGSGTPFKVFAPFWRALGERMPPDAPLPAPAAIPPPERWPESDVLDTWGLLPTEPNWATGFDWTPGEAAATEAVRRFARALEGYHASRNLPSVEGTSRLSPYLHFGEISPRQVWHALDGTGEGAQSYRRELAWRDFTSGLILALPRYGAEHGRARFDKLAWRIDAGDLKAWQRGRTGYPIVDAGMRQLWTSGWLHNRVRMIVASFLVKHLLIDWREGERWFWDTLIDADYGNNSVNWQWVAGSGVDASAFTRIMAPLVQSEKFDAAGYIRRWVPELRDVPGAAIHDPDEAGLRPADYPPKMIAHRAARERALTAAVALR